MSDTIQVPQMILCPGRGPDPDKPPGWCASTIITLGVNGNKLCRPATAGLMFSRENVAQRFVDCHDGDWHLRTLEPAELAELFGKQAEAVQIDYVVIDYADDATDRAKRVCELVEPRAACDVLKSYQDGQVPRFYAPRFTVQI